jgi:hypothetical protein
MASTFALPTLTLSFNSTHHIFVDVDTKGLGQVLRDLRAAESGVAPLESTDGSDQFR